MKENEGNLDISKQSNQEGNDIFGSEESFFEALESDVNGAIVDDTEVTQQEVGPEQVTQSENVGSNSVKTQDDGNWEKRYKDSSREAIKWREKYKEVESFIPILDEMKNNSGLVDHVQDYYTNGGKPPKTLNERLGLDEDFVFDPQEAMSEPESDSAKLLNAQVDSIVDKRVGQMTQQQQAIAQKQRAEFERQKAENDFKQRKNMSNEEFEAFKQDAQRHTLSLDDIDYILNKDKVNANATRSAKNDMLNQMKNVRNIPTSSSGANSQTKEESPEDAIFNGISSLDNGLDNLFG